MRNNKQVHNHVILGLNQPKF